MKKQPRLSRSARERIMKDERLYSSSISPGLTGNRFHGRFIDKGNKISDFIRVQIQVWHLGRFDRRIRQKLLEVIRRKPLSAQIESGFSRVFRIHFDVSM